LQAELRRLAKAQKRSVNAVVAILLADGISQWKAGREQVREQVQPLSFAPPLHVEDENLENYARKLSR